VTAVTLLAQLSGLGVTAWADGGTLRFKPKSLIPPDVLADMRAHKAELLALLSGADPNTHATAGLFDPETIGDHRDHRPTDQWPDAGDAGIPRRYPSAVAGLLRASLCRPVSWADATARPSPGSWCRNCEGSGWWGNASGWRCWTCHPPGGLALGTFEEVRT
jgi:TubC N-terminal docking domain